MAAKAKKKKATTKAKSIDINIDELLAAPKMPTSDEMGHPIVLGNKVRDVPTGFEGTASCLVEMLHASRHYVIEAVGEKGKKGDFVSADVNRVVFVDDGVAALMPPVDNSVSLHLGEKVRDTVSKFEEFLIERITHLNGCVTFIVQGEAKKKREEPKSRNINHKQLEKIGEGVRTPSTDTFQAKPAQERTGSFNDGDAARYFER